MYIEPPNSLLLKSPLYNWNSLSGGGSAPALPTLLVTTAKGLGASGGNSDPIDTSGAGLLVLTTYFYPAGAVTVSDSKGNTWTKINTATAVANVAFDAYYAVPPIITGPGHYFTATGPGVYCSLSLSAWSGTLAASPIDGGIGNVGTVTNTILTGLYTPSRNNLLLMSTCAHESNGGAAITVDSGFTKIAEVLHGSGYEGGAQAYLQQSAAAPVNVAWYVVNNTAIAAGVVGFVFA